MNPKIITITQKKLIGMQSRMHRHEFENIIALWQQFMPRQKELQNRLTSEFMALQVYDDFNALEKPYDIWACVEVSNFENVPNGMKTLIIPESTYAVFPHKGMDASKTYFRIMTEWLPNSGYSIDNRPHFQVMGERYRNGSPDSEEDFFVPVKTIKK